MSDVTLYDTTSEFREMLDLMQRYDDDPDEKTLAKIERIIRAETTKVQNVTKFLAVLDSQQALAEAEIKRLRARKERLDRHDERLRYYILRVMDEHGFDRLDGETASLVIRKSPPAVMVFDQNAVPPEFITVKTEIVVNKTNVGAALKAGRDVPGCQLVQGRKVVVK